MKIDIMQLEFIDYNLRVLAVEIEKSFGVPYVITSLYRINDTGVHGTLPLRGLDFRCTNDVWGKMIADYVNAHWVYDESRVEKMCCLYHDAGQGKHIHLQVCNKTYRKEVEELK